jgi:hypothetical protein
VTALDLALAPGRFAVCRLAPDDPLPPGLLDAAEFVAVVRTPTELSIVCPERLAPSGARCESGWRLIQVAGPLDFALTGILLSLLDPLARVGVSVFAASTYDTDYLLIKEATLDRARQALAAAGHRLATQLWRRL